MLSPMHGNAKKQILWFILYTGRQKKGKKKMVKI